MMLKQIDATALRKQGTGPSPAYYLATGANEPVMDHT